MPDELTAEELDDLRIKMGHADEGNGVADVPTYTLAKLIAAAERAKRLEEALREIENYEADYAMQTDWNLNVLRDIARTALEQAP